MSVIIIAEAGSNWRLGSPVRDLAMARALIEVAAEARADYVKFQTYRAQTLYVANAGKSDYMIEHGIEESIYDILDDSAMSYEMLPRLAEHCKKYGIGFLSTPFSLNDARAVDPFVQLHKIASYEISHSRLIEFVASTGKPLILSTGGASIKDIAWAIEHFKAHGGHDMTLMQCTAKYPAPMATLNLQAIPTLKTHFGVNVGLSDHSRDPIIGPVGAVALGATIIEKHFTLHNRIPGPDHPFAITATELVELVAAVRHIEEALGNGEKVIQTEEQELRAFAQRSLQTTRDIARGELLIDGVNLDILRPGKQRQGLHPCHLPRLKNRPAARDIPAGDGLYEGDWI
ncbi:N-acylneuraminate-9-phosphate synthase [Desulfovibrionales bacterium]